MDSLPSTSSLLAHRAATINLAAGPSSLPTPVLLQATAGLLDYNGTGIGLTELSHRSSHFQNLVKDAESDLRTLLEIPDNFDVVFLQGGGLSQFAMVPMNLVSAWKLKNASSQSPRLDYVVSGSWSHKACGEARRLGYDVNVVVDGRALSDDKKTFGTHLLPDESQWSWQDPSPSTSSSSSSSLPAFVYYCSNETVNGIEIPPPRLPEHYKDVPIVADMSSNIASRSIPWKGNNFGLIYAGAQKNLGPAGCTIVIVRKDLVADPDQAVAYGGDRIPAMMSYKSHVDSGSLYNTPPMFSIYVCSLVFKYLLELGGVAKIDEVNEMKARSVYAAIDESEGFYSARVVEGFRSRMNVCFGVPGQDGQRETRFIAEADKAGIKQIKGHRWVVVVGHGTAAGGLKKGHYG